MTAPDPSDQPENPARPDVTVVVPVYNTMPYLTACLNSLVAQSIGAGRLQVVAVDDGSTDGSGEELERYAARHPDLFTVVHQPNSGGPAGPCNRGLELATGRYLFFLGADDYLGEEAMERMVARADEWDSDVVLGRMVGVGGRGVSQLLFGSTQQDVPFPHSDLPYAVANTKLFRRELVEEHRIRYALDLRVGSDQPFTIEAMLRARRVSVLADYTYYYAVRREDSANISFSSTWLARLEDIGHVMDHVAELVPPGEDRDAILARHFAWELNNRLKRDFAELVPEGRRQMCAVVGGLADRYLTPGVSRRLRVAARLRIRLAQTGDVAGLGALNAFVEEERTPAVAAVDEAAYLAYPGFGTLPDEWFEAIVEGLRRRVEESVTLASVAWHGSTLLVSADTALHPRSVDRVRVVLVPLRAGKQSKPPRRIPRGKEGTGLAVPVLLEGYDEGGSRLTARVDLRPFLGTGAPRRRWALRFRLDVGGRTYDLPAQGAPGATAGARVATRFYRLVARHDAEGRMLVVRRRIPARDAVRERLRSR